jgi:hypothetical protein
MTRSNIAVVTHPFLSSLDPLPSSFPRDEIKTQVRDIMLFLKLRKLPVDNIWYYERRVSDLLTVMAKSLGLVWPLTTNLWL